MCGEKLKQYEFTQLAHQAFRITFAKLHYKQGVCGVETAVPASMWTVSTRQPALTCPFSPFCTSSSLNSTEPRCRTTPFMEHQVHLLAFPFYFFYPVTLSTLLFMDLHLQVLKHSLHLCLDEDVQYNVAFLYRLQSSSSS